MVARDLISTELDDLDPDARPVVAGYLRELAAALPGSRRTRAAIITEIADGVIEEITHTAGRTPPRLRGPRSTPSATPAPRGAIRRQLTGRAADRTGLALVGSGPLIGGLWLLAVTGGRPTGTWPGLPARTTRLLTALPWLPPPLNIIVPTALVAIAGAGPAARILPVTAETAGVAGVVAGAGCVLVDVTLIGHVLLLAAGWSPALIAATAISATRLVLAGAAARRCALLRAAGSTWPIAPLRCSARQVSGTPTAAGSSQYRIGGRRSHKRQVRTVVHVEAGQQHDVGTGHRATMDQQPPPWPAAAGPPAGEPQPAATPAMRNNRQSCSHRSKASTPADTTTTSKPQTYTVPARG